ncbi:MAG: barstar family protein [Catonella sp.]|uniref:barstar family protein n=1 Tax=Catonella sp. TaxID=2382125 RepID=UPI003F9F1F7E
MEEIVIDCGEMATKAMAHAYLEGVFNWDEDSITDTDTLLEYLLSIDESTEITFEDVDLLEINLGEYGQEILETFEQAEQSNENIKLV